MKNEAIIKIFRIFTDPDKIRAKRAAHIDTAAVFQTLVSDAKHAIERWTDPENDAFAKLTTRNTRAAEMLIAALRSDGYAADLHWHGSKNSEESVVQFALHESNLERAHHDPRL